MNYFWNIPAESQDDTAPSATSTTGGTGGADKATTPTTTIILAHGFGANERDLEGLSHEISLPLGDIRWLFPRAPVSIQTNSYAWFPSDRKHIELAAAGTYFQNMAELSVPELGVRARELAADARELGVVWENTFIGGFSQGSMLALRTVLELRLPVRGILLFSSSLIDERVSAELIARCPPAPVFQSHGIYDPLLSFGNAGRLAELLRKAGWNVAFHAFHGAHAIPLEIVRKSSEFIASHII